MQEQDSASQENALCIHRRSCAHKEVTATTYAALENGKSMQSRMPLQPATMSTHPTPSEGLTVLLANVPAKQARKAA
jgi:hypothetical protein